MKKARPKKKKKRLHNIYFVTRHYEKGKTKGTEIRSVVARSWGKGLSTKEHSQVFCGNGNVLYLD